MMGWGWAAGLPKRGKPYLADAKKHYLYHQALCLALQGSGSGDTGAMTAIPAPF
ncbi:MAG: hypothetical protein ACI94O_001784, partial [Octadecabacter sp.]|jgi:hypothetical protein